MGMDYSLVTLFIVKNIGKRREIHNLVLKMMKNNGFNKFKKRFQNKNMKKILVLLTMVMSFGLIANAQSKPAEFKFEAETHDFGKITVNKPVTYEVKYTNVGAEPLIITKAEASCGCTTPKYTTVPLKKRKGTRDGKSGQPARP